MRPIRVTATNYRSFDRLDFTFPQTVAAVAGPNGAGKTSLVQLTDTVLFADGGRDLAAMLREGAEEMVLELEFEHAGGTYRVRRTYRDGKSAKVDLERAEIDTTELPEFYGLRTGDWSPLTRETTAETQKAITTLLGFDRDAFRASAMSAQGDGDAFTTAGPADRKKVLASILGLDIWDALRDQARRDLTDANAALQRHDGAQAERRDLVDTKPHVESLLAAAKDALDQAEAAVATATVAHERAVTADRDLERARTQLAEARAAMTTADSTARDLSMLRDRAVTSSAAAANLAQEIIGLERIAGNVTHLEQEWARVEEQTAARQKALHERERATQAVDAREQAARVKRTEIARLRKAADDADAHADRILEEPAGHACDRCGQQLGTEAASNTIASLRADALRDRLASDELNTVTTDEEAAIFRDRTHIAAMVIPAEPDRGDLQQRLTTARQAGTDLAAAQARLQEHERVAAEWTDDHDHRLVQAREAQTTAHAAVTAAEQALPLNADEIHQRVHATDRQVAEARAARDTAREQHIRATTRLEHITQAEAHLAAADEERQALIGRIDLLTLADRCYGPNGVPALIVENTAIPQIEADANTYLHQLGTTYQVELRTQRDLKTSDAKKETLDIVVHTPSGERDYTTFSGGERTRVDVALRIALARLLAHRAGANSELLVIDEPDGLDVEGMERLAGILHGLLGDFATVLVVSHNPALGAAFETTIVVDRDGDTSRILEAAGA